VAATDNQLREKHAAAVSNQNKNTWIFGKIREERDFSIQIEQDSHETQRTPSSLSHLIIET
jgi:hypothetical protein